MPRFVKTASVCAVVLLAGLIAAPAQASAGAAAPVRTRTPIQHFVFLMQGDRSFDNYFGTYPGADGLPAGTCQPLVLGRAMTGCVQPFPLHGTPPAALETSRSIVTGQINGGHMDGFVAAYHRQGRDGTSAMGYYDERDVPYYWHAAQEYVLFDRFFSAVPYGIRLNRSYWVAAAPPPGGSEKVPARGFGASQATIFDRLEQAGVSWKFYVQDFNPAENFKAVSATDPASQTARVPLLNYARFVNDPALRGHIVDLDEYYRDVEQGTLPAVAYVASAGASERSARSIPTGQRLVRGMVNTLMMSQYWDSSAFMWSYDGSGGWYDHVPPQRIQGQDSGLRVPALLISPYAHAGQVNHTVMDYTSALRFIEDNWAVAALSTRDSSAPSLMSAFDFTTARRAHILSDSDAIPQVPQRHAALIYVSYGGAGLIALLLLGVAVRGLRWPAVERWATPTRRRRSEVSSA